VPAWALPSPKGNAKKLPVTGILFGNGGSHTTSLPNTFLGSVGAAATAHNDDGAFKDLKGTLFKSLREIEINTDGGKVSCADPSHAAANLDSGEEEATAANNASDDCEDDEDDYLEMDDESFYDKENSMDVDDDMKPPAGKATSPDSSYVLVEDLDAGKGSGAKGDDVIGDDDHVVMAFQHEDFNGGIPLKTSLYIDWEGEDKEFIKASDKKIYMDDLKLTPWHHVKFLPEAFWKTSMQRSKRRNGRRVP